MSRAVARRPPSRRRSSVEASVPEAPPVSDNDDDEPVQELGERIDSNGVEAHDPPHEVFTEPEPEPEPKPKPEPEPELEPEANPAPRRGRSPVRRSTRRRAPTSSAKLASKKRTVIKPLSKDADEVEDADDTPATNTTPTKRRTSSRVCDRLTAQEILLLTFLVFVVASLAMWVTGLDEAISDMLSYHANNAIATAAEESHLEAVSRDDM